MFENRIGNVGCEVISTLFDDPNCNLHKLNLWSNGIGNNEGATALANGLVRNNKLRKLYINSTLSFDPSVENIFSRILCNTSSVSSIYSSNHTLGWLFNVSRLGRRGETLTNLLQLNEETNKSHVAIKKILKYHRYINMEPFFEWKMEGERNLKALPYVLSWFYRAGEAIADEEEREIYNVNQSRRHPIYLRLYPPLLFVPAAHIKEGNNKRKRGENNFE